MRISKVKWEYNAVRITTTNLNIIQNTLNAEGEQGWELVGITDDGTGVDLYFKRVKDNN